MTRKICLLIFKRDSFVKHNKLRLRYKWNTAGCCTGSGFNAAILKISQFPALTKKKKNSHQQQIHHGNQGQAMAVGPFSHHRRKRFFSTYEGYKEVKSTVVNKQVTNELKHMRGGQIIIDLGWKVKALNRHDKNAVFQRKNETHLSGAENKLPLWKKQQESMNRKPKMPPKCESAAPNWFGITGTFKIDCVKRNYSISMSALVTLSMKNTISSTSG